MITHFDPAVFTKVYHKKYGTQLVIEKKASFEFLKASDDTFFTCYRLGENDLIYSLKAYSFPKRELTLNGKRVKVA